MLLFSEYPDKSYKFTPYSFQISFLTIPPHLQLISSTTTTPKCTLHSALLYLLQVGMDAVFRYICIQGSIVFKFQDHNTDKI